MAGQVGVDGLSVCVQWPLEPLYVALQLSGLKFALQSLGLALREPPLQGLVLQCTRKRFKPISTKLPAGLRRKRLDVILGSCPRENLRPQT